MVKGYDTFDSFFKKGIVSRCIEMNNIFVPDTSPEKLQTYDKRLFIINYWKVIVAKEASGEEAVTEDVQTSKCVLSMQC